MSEQTLSKLMLAAVFGLLISATAAAKVTTSNPPNIVLIMADDVGQECFGCYGSQEYKTPNIDRLAANGIRFTNAHSCPICTPSRVKLMTGRSNVRNYFAFSILPRTEKTFAHMLKESGYRTVVAGKWQLFGAKSYGELAGSGTTPNDAGFDEYCLWQIEKLGSRYWKPQLNQNGQYLQTGEDDYGPTLCADFICDFIHRNQKQPFFVYYPMILPHSPFQPTPRSEDRSRKNKKQNFVDMVQYVDELVGRIDKQLESSGIRDNTLLMFVADNGTHRNIRSRFGGREVRGAKGLTIDDGTHIPFVASWPNAMNKSSVCEDLIDLSDFLPTIASVVGRKPPISVKLDGVSFAPQLRCEPNPDARSAIYCYYNPRPGGKRYPQPVTYARDKRWKLYGDGRLFDVVADRMEEHPIRASNDNPQSKSARKQLTEVIESMPREGQNVRRKPSNR